MNINRVLGRKMGLFSMRWCLMVTMGMIVLGGWHSPAQAMELRVSGQTITLKADKVPLHSILRRLSATGIAVKVDPSVNPVVTADFRNRNIQEAMDQILGDNSHVLFWKKDSRGEIALSRIVIYRDGLMDAASPLAASPGLDIEKDPETGGIYVKNKILMQFRPPVDSKRIRAILKKFGAGIKLYHEGLGVYEVTLPDGSRMADALAALGEVSGGGIVEPDYAYKTPVPLQYATDHQVPRQENSSQAVGSSPVAVLDSGLDPNFLSQDLNLASLDALMPEEAISDTVGHGTQMALIASGQVDPMGGENEAFLNPVLSVRAFDDNGYTSNAILLKGIDFAVENGAKVLSLSWGSETDSAFLKQAMAYARSRGLHIVAAAGNAPTGKPVYPAAYDTVLSVAALAPDGKAWDKSNYGDFVDVAAPGFAQLPVGHKGDPGTYAGTSIATAYVAGKLAAYLRENPGQKIDIEKLLE